MTERALDVICLGRSSVDLYGDQLGLPLEDVNSFSKYVGGCATNIAIGTSRLGLKSGLITRVGDEQMGRFIRQTLIEEGVDVSLVSTDPDRLTALVILGIRDRTSSPHIFYRDNCADMALGEEHIDPSIVASAHVLVLTGTHFSQPGVEAASRAAMKAAKAGGTRIALDIDYRPVAWGLTSHGDGENRFIASETVTAHVQSIVADCDLLVGTEEEINIAGGHTSTIQSLKALRGLTSATLVVKRGPMGCSVFPKAIPETLDDGISVAGREIEVFNTLGAGDGFMSGFLRGWVKNESWETCCTYGNAAGALVVSRHGCAPAIPSWQELEFYLTNGSASVRLRDDKVLARLHRATTGRKSWPQLCAVAFDHRPQFEKLADGNTVSRERIGAFKKLAATAAQQVSLTRPGIGIIADDIYGEDSLAQFTGSGLWLARPVELPESWPLRFQHGENIMRTLREWPKQHVAKCLVQYRIDDPDHIRADQEHQVELLYDACITTGHELLLEIIPRDGAGSVETSVRQSVERFYDLDIYPDWWKLPASSDPGHWQALSELVARRDPQCRGILVLGQSAPIDDLMRDFSHTVDVDMCKGFAVGRTLFQVPAEAWFAGRADDEETIEAIKFGFQRLITAWEARNTTLESASA